MEVWHGLSDVGRPGRSVVTLGVFDGVHRGHRQLIDRVVNHAKDRQAPAVVVTFDPHPASVLRSDKAPVMLGTLPHRLDLIASLGVDATLVLRFTLELAAQSAIDFTQAVLVDTLSARDVYVGRNFRFGHRAAGDVDDLTRYGQQNGFAVHPVEITRSASGIAWSSSYIRTCLATGDVEHAAEALGRPHRVEGVVVHGDHRGRELGYPTANLGPATAGERVAIPADGVYAGWLQRASGERLPAAISVGTNPTFGGTVQRVEAYVLDRTDLDLYDEHVAIDFTHRLRETVRFDDVESLLEQMHKDVATARVLTA